MLHDVNEHNVTGTKYVNERDTMLQGVNLLINAGIRLIATRPALYQSAGDENRIKDF